MDKENEKVITVKFKLRDLQHRLGLAALPHNLDPETEVSFNMLPIDSPEAPNLITKALGNEEFVLAKNVYDVREKLSPEQEKMFNWLKQSPENAQLYIEDAPAAAQKAGVSITPELKSWLEQIGFLLDPS